MTSTTWVAIAALIVGALVRSLKQDALGAILTKLFRPDGPPVVIPTRLLPWLALAFGVTAALLDAKTAGATWNDAVQSGVLAAAGAVFGHELLSGVPGAKKLLGAMLLVGAFSATTACAFLRDAADVTKKVLTVADIVCLETGDGSQITEAKEAAAACRIINAAPEVIQIIERLIGQREAGRKAGFNWEAHVDADAGADAH